MIVPQMMNAARMIEIINGLRDQRMWYSAAVMIQKMKVIQDKKYPTSTRHNATGYPKALVVTRNEQMRIGRKIRQRRPMMM